MAGKLDDMIAPDERVVYRARYGFRDALTNLLLIAAWFVVLWVALFWPVSFEPWEYYFILASISGWGAFESWSAFTKTSVVTDRRFLYMAGFINSKIHDIPLAEIAGVGCYPAVLMFRRGTIRVRAGGTTTHRFVPDAESVCRAIRTEAGLRQPSALTRKVIVWAWLVNVFTIAFGCRFAIEAMESAIDWAETYMPFHEELGFILILPFTLVPALIGLYVFTALVLSIARVFLSADEAKQLICLDYAYSSDIKWLDRLTRGHVRLEERFLSLLYGQTIRCADGE
ncbi:MAG: PH domain-containing protein [Proteobacteria bacterium]|nr:PH domain-containing protein [Pseudomonadota bacterium]